MNKKIFIIAFAIISFFIFSNEALALTKTWDGGGADNNWSTALNWSNDTVPATGDDIIFDATSTKASMVDAGFTATPLSVSINSGYTGTITLNRSLIINGNFTLTQGTFNANGQDVAVNGNLDASGSSTRTITFGTGTWTIAGSRFDLTGTNITKNASNGLVDFTGNTTINTGITTWSRLFRNINLAYPTRIITFEALSSSTVVLADGQIRLKGGTITKSGGNSANLHAVYNSTYSTNIIFDSPTALSSIMVSFRNETGGSSWQISGGDFGSATTIDFLSWAGTNPQIILLNDISLNSGIMRLFSCNTCPASGLVVDFNGKNVTVPEIRFGETWGTGNNTLNMGNGSITITGSNGLRVLNNSGSHTLNMQNATINIAGNWTTVNGTGSITVIPGTSTVNLTGGSQIISGINSFYNITKSVSAAATLTFPASTTTTINGVLTLNGALGQLLSLRSSTNGTPFIIADLGSENIQYADVQDSSATNSIIAYNSNDSGNNMNWLFGTGSPGSLRYTCGSGDGTSAIQVQASTTLPTVSVWANVACVFSDTANTLSIFVNGVNEGSTIFSGTPQTNDNSVYLGQSNANGQWFNGEIDEAALWSRPLPSSEVEAFSLMCYNPGSYLKDYLVEIPKDPSSGTDADTGYAISRQSSGVITVQSIAPQAIDNITPEIKFSR